MIRGAGGEVEIEGGKLTLEEQIALAEAAEKARLEKEALEKAEALAEWEAYKAEQLVLANTKADSLTASTAPVITTATNAAKTKANWIRTEVANSKNRVNDNILKLKETVDPDERASIEAEVASEMHTLDGWTTPRPVDARRILEVKIRDRKAAGMDVKALEAELAALTGGGKA
jgi:hypothetical protein